MADVFATSLSTFSVFRTLALRDSKAVIITPISSGRGGRSRAYRGFEETSRDLLPSEKERGNGHGHFVVIGSFINRWKRMANTLLLPCTHSEAQPKQSWYDFYAVATGKERAVKLMLRALAQQLKGKSILDLTAGAGMTSKALLEVLSEQGHTFEKLVVNDPSHSFLAYAKERVTNAMRKLGLTNAAVEFSSNRLTSKRGQEFDVVVWEGGSIHFASQEERKAISLQVLQLLKKGGLFVVIDKDSWNSADLRMPTKIAKSISVERTFLDFSRYAFSVIEAWTNVLPKNAPIESRELKPFALDPASAATLHCQIFQKPFAHHI